jgi:hypothetical protein
MPETGGGQHHGGIWNEGGTINSGGGDIVGGDKSTTTYSPIEINNAWQGVADAIQTAPPEKQAAAREKLQDLKTEVAKAARADDSTVAKLLKDLVGLVPSAVSAVVGAFGTPILGGVAGPVTKFVLGELGEADK